MQAKLNVPFTGGLSSYSAFLLVLAAHDRCLYSDTRPAIRKATGASGSAPATVSGSVSGSVSGPVSGSVSGPVSVTVSGPVLDPSGVPLSDPLLTQSQSLPLPLPNSSGNSSGIGGIGGTGDSEGAYTAHLGQPTLPVRIVSEGEVFMHFLSLYSLSSSTFNPAVQGIGK